MIQDHLNGRLSSELSSLPVIKTGAYFQEPWSRLKLLADLRIFWLKREIPAIQVNSYKKCIKVFIQSLISAARNFIQILNVKE
uniref:Uncharacterized protein n=1 Tax=Rhizophagus irregularis (strain DAOM 181602 / DAOM 197198 / MUCL 43194) TaxID=747089 RepID=U9URD6_RHIID